MDKLLTITWKENYDAAFTGDRYVSVTSQEGSGFIISSSDPTGNPFNFVSYDDGEFLDIGPIKPSTTFYLICKQRTDVNPLIKSLICTYTQPLVLNVTWEEVYPDDYLGDRFFNVSILNGRGFTVSSTDMVNNPFYYNSNLNSGEEKHLGPIKPTSAFNLLIKNKEGSVGRVLQCGFAECVLSASWNTTKTSGLEYYFDVSCTLGSGWTASGGGFTFSGEDGTTTEIGPIVSNKSFMLEIKSNRDNKIVSLYYNPFFDAIIVAEWEFPELYTPSYLGPRYFNVTCENTTGWVASGGGFTFSGSEGTTKHCGPIYPITPFILEITPLQGEYIVFLGCDYDMGSPLYVVFYPPISTTQNKAWDSIFFNCKHDFGLFNEIPLNRSLDQVVSVQGPFLTKNEFFNASVELKDYNTETPSAMTFDTVKIQLKGGFPYTTPSFTSSSIISEINNSKNKKEQHSATLAEDRLTSFSFPHIPLSSENVNVIIISATIQTKSSDTEPTPIAQSFFVNDTLFPSGLYLSGVDLFFKTKSQTYPISVEIRESVNGYPHFTESLPFSKVYVEAKDIAISNDSTVPTHFEFDTPIYLPPGEFHLCIKSATTDYTAYIATIGNYLLGSATERVTKQTSVGSLFKSANSSTWVPVQEADLKFILYRCKFEQSDLPFNAELMNVSPLIEGELPFETVTLNGKTVEPPGCSLESNKFTIINYETSFKQFLNKTLELQSEFKIGN